MMIRLAIIIPLALPLLSTSFVIDSQATARPGTMLFDGDGTGGWGIGSSRELTPEEFARSDRQYFDGYQMSEQGDFRQQIAEDKKAMRKAELEELLGYVFEKQNILLLIKQSFPFSLSWLLLNNTRVAQIAGISVKNPSDRLNKFEPEISDDDDDDLDLSV